MQKNYKYRLSKRGKMTTVTILLIILAAAVLLVIYSDSGFMPAWGIFFLVTAALLYTLSIPRKIRITDDALEIHCLVELTRINMENIKSIEKIDRTEIKYTFPMLASYGFFGYYGYYYNFAEMNMFKVYVSQWHNLMRIEDIYEDVYIINCDNPDELMHFVNKARSSANKKAASEKTAH